MYAVELGVAEKVDEARETSEGLRRVRIDEVVLVVAIVALRDRVACADGGDVWVGLCAGTEAVVGF